jgi:hypothetical protein
MTYPLLAYLTHEVNRYEEGINDITQKDWIKLSNSSIHRYKVIQYIRESTPKNSLFLVYRMSDFAYYAERKFIQHADPLLNDLYMIDNKDQAHKFLLGLGVDYIYIPNYSDPTYYSTQIYRITADPTLSELIKQTGGYRLFKLHQSKRNVTTESVDIGGVLHVITTQIEMRYLRRAFRKVLGREGFANSDSVTAYDLNLANDEDHHDSLTVRNSSGYNTFIYTGSKQFDLSPHNSFSKSGIRPGMTYRLSADIQGKGVLKIILVGYLKNHKIKREQIWSSVLSNKSQFIESQFIASSYAYDYRIMIVLEGQGTLSMNGFTLEKVLNGDIPDKWEDIHQDNRMRWSTVLASNFEDVDPDKPESSGWFISSKQRSLSDSWGLTTESRNGKYALYMKKPDNDYYYWLYMGRRDVISPKASPLKRFTNAVGKKLLGFEQTFSRTQRIEFPENKFDILSRITVSLKGSGYADLFLWWLDSEGKRVRKYIGRYVLPEEYKTLSEVFELSNDAEIAGVGFNLLDVNDELSTLYIDDFRLEQQISGMYSQSSGE